MHALPYSPGTRGAGLRRHDHARRRTHVSHDNGMALHFDREDYVHDIVHKFNARHVSKDKTFLFRYSVMTLSCILYRHLIFPIKYHVTMSSCTMACPITELP